MDSLTGGIVLYNPNLVRLRENINAVINQLDLLILIDNGSTNINEVKRIYKDVSKIKIIESKFNKGIAWALNKIMYQAKENKSEWCLLLDQDTICPNNLITSYLDYLNKTDEEIAIICPLVYDLNKDKNQAYHEKESQLVQNCITSGTLNSISIWEKVGEFDERLFIDGVDHEYCLRLDINNFKIVRMNKVSIFHEIGKITYKRFLFWRIETKNHNSFRKYYIVRNIFYLEKKYKKDGFAKTIMKVLKQFFLVIYLEDDKLLKLKKMILGVIDGLKMNYNTEI